MEKGTVKVYFPDREYGFILTESDEEYYFTSADIHPKSRHKRIYEGQMVKFDLVLDLKGERAKNIRLEN